MRQGAHVRPPGPVLAKDAKPTPCRLMDTTLILYVCIKHSETQRKGINRSREETPRIAEQRQSTGEGKRQQRIRYNTGW
ncbi:hypothetical protein GDO81_002933 [Engystomops pustulosus]|uniref:Uncharacterized protein n=1 Tax=Engystomops pustulosus TaxID=76066 RepID=A0AAV7DNT0_ENGPU|nr:hypothetical protein GDO81_002933 [Engystomops pustulosus]